MPAEKFFSSCEHQRPDRVVPGHPVHVLDKTGDVRDTQEVQPVRAQKSYDGDAVPPDL